MKIEQKEEDKKTDDKGGEEGGVVVEAKDDLLKEMIAMGFNIDLSKQALIKVKNESLAAAIDAVIEIQKIQDKEKAKLVDSIPKKAIIQSWECKTCTFINIEGKAVCDMCTVAAPDTAYLIVKSEEEKKKEEEEENKKAREEEEAK